VHEEKPRFILGNAKSSPVPFWSIAQGSKPSFASPGRAEARRHCKQNHGLRRIMVDAGVGLRVRNRSENKAIIQQTSGSASKIPGRKCAIDEKILILALATLLP
jgi:hypothetical protein